MGIHKIEGALKRRFTTEMKRQLPNFLILQYATAGAPDRTIIGAGRQTNFEMKHGTPDFESPGQQELMLCRIAACSHARYVIWQDIRGIQRTLIVLPSIVHRRSSWLLDAEASCPGFDMRWLVEQVRTAHGL